MTAQTTLNKTQQIFTKMFNCPRRRLQRKEPSTSFFVHTWVLDKYLWILHHPSCVYSTVLSKAPRCLWDPGGIFPPAHHWHRPRLKKVFPSDWIRSGVWGSCCIQVSLVLWAIFGQRSYSFLLWYCQENLWQHPWRSFMLPSLSHSLDPGNYFPSSTVQSVVRQKHQPYFFIVSCRKSLVVLVKHALLSSRALTNCFKIPSFRWIGGNMILSQGTRDWFSVFGSPGLRLCRTGQFFFDHWFLRSLLYHIHREHGNFYNLFTDQEERLPSLDRHT